MGGSRRGALSRQLNGYLCEFDAKLAEGTAAPAAFERLCADVKQHRVVDDRLERAGPRDRGAALLPPKGQFVHCTPLGVKLVVLFFRVRALLGVDGALRLRLHALGVHVACRLERGGRGDLDTANKTENFGPFDAHLQLSCGAQMQRRVQLVDRLLRDIEAAALRDCAAHLLRQLRRGLEDNLAVIHKDLRA